MRSAYPTKCIMCDAVFYVPHNRLDKAKYCSMKCMSDGKTTVIQGGENYGKLTILKEVAPEIQYYKGKPIKLRVVECLCECGNTTITRWTMLRNGETKSCGCLKLEHDYINFSEKNKSNRVFGEPTHGYSNHPLYVRWLGMLTRCYIEDNDNYADYGARGIRVNERWHKIENFIEDMYPTFNPKLQLERLDNDGDYGKGNCVWATRKIQANNKRNTVWVFYNGNRKALSLICDDLKINKQRVYCLMQYHKVDFECALKLYNK